MFVVTTKIFIHMSLSSSSFFDLCPDILLDIFQYFSLNELYDIFIDLIPNLLILINQSYIEVHIDKNANEDFWNTILPKINSNQIISLNNSYLITNLSQFTSIRSINLNLQSLFLFEQFQYLIYLEQLSIQLSEVILEQLWLDPILILPKLNKLKLALTTSKHLLLPQKPISIEKPSYQSNTIKYLELKIPMSWQSILLFLSHFPNIQIFRASLYQLDSIHHVSAIPMCFKFLKVLNLQGYFQNMSLIITSVSTSMRNLKQCRLKAMNVTTDDAFSMKYAFIWKYLLEYCTNLIKLQIHLIMSTEINNNFNIRLIKDLIRTFNDNPFCEKYHFRMEQMSINRGYVTLTGDYDIKKIKFS